MHKSAYLRLGDNPAEDPDWDVGVEDVLAMPYYAGGLPEDPYAGQFDSHATIYYDRVPKGEVEVRRASGVISTDDELLGEVDGFVVDADEHITHFVLERGHLWGRKEVTIPIGAVARVESDAVHSRCPRTRSAPSRPFASADTADAPEAGRSRRCTNSRNCFGSSEVLQRRRPSLLRVLLLPNVQASPRNVIEPSRSFDSAASRRSPGPGRRLEGYPRPRRNRGRLDPGHPHVRSAREIADRRSG